MTSALNRSVKQYPEEAILPQYFPLSSDFAEPSPVFVAPGNYHFRENPESNDECPYFPDKGTADLLLSQYWERVHPVARVLHRHSFEERWEIFWETHFSGQKCEKSLLALVFAALFSGLISMPDDVALNLLKCNKRILMEKVQAATDFALARSNWIRSTKVEMIQAVVVYLVSVHTFQ